MARKQNISKKSNLAFSNISILLFSASIIVLYFNSKINDPFSAPKFIILVVSSALLLPNLVIFRGKFLKANSRKPIPIIILISLFISTGIISMLNSGITYYSLFGDLQRRNGLLTYFCFSIFLISAYINFNHDNIKNLYVCIFLTGLVFSFYGIQQITGNDFVNWSNPYNAIIGTLGNPNYAASAIALFAALNFAYAIVFSISNIYRFVLILLALIQAYLIYLSNSRQGLVSLSLALMIIIFYKLYVYKKKMSFLFGLLSISLITLSILGMLQKGFLASVLYKESVSVRGYYWRAGIEMFKNNPLFGVGIDQYGYFFREYREKRYSLIYGDAITSTNAHNVFIQHFATGGVFFGLAYLILMAYILKSAIKGIKYGSEHTRQHLVILLSLWALIQSISVISIDNFGFTIWNYIISGAILALSFKTKRDEAFELSTRLDITKQTFKTFLTIFLLIPTLITSVNLYRNESNMIKVRSLFKPGSNLTNSPDFKNYGDKIFEAKLIEPSYLVNTAGYYAVMGDQTKAFEILNEVVMKNPRNQDALFILADFKRQIKDFSDAAYYFEEIAKIDPWNVTNFFSLAEAYVELGDNGKAQESLFKILDITNNYDQRKRASDLLAKLN